MLKKLQKLLLCVRYIKSCKLHVTRVILLVLSSLQYSWMEKFPLRGTNATFSNVRRASCKVKGCKISERFPPFLPRGDYPWFASLGFAAQTARARKGASPSSRSAARRASASPTSAHKSRVKALRTLPLPATMSRRGTKSLRMLIYQSSFPHSEPSSLLQTSLRRHLRWLRRICLKLRSFCPDKWLGRTKVRAHLGSSVFTTEAEGTVLGFQVTAVEEMREPQRASLSKDPVWLDESKKPRASWVWSGPGVSSVGGGRNTSGISTSLPAIRSSVYKHHHRLFLANS